MGVLGGDLRADAADFRHAFGLEGAALWGWW